MLKHSVLVLAVVLLFALSMVAQTGSTSSGASSGSQTGQSGSSSSAQTEQPGSTSSSQSGTYGTGSQSSGSEASTSSGSQAGQSGTSSGSQSGTYGSGSQSQTGTSDMSSQSGMSDQGKQGKAKSVEGCLVQQQSEYVVFTKKGKPMRVSGQDFTAHVGHHVRLHGTEQRGSGMASASGTDTTGGTAGATTSGSMGQTGQSTTGTTGSMAGSQTGSTAGSQTGATGSTSGGMTGESGRAANLSDKELIVDRVEHIAATCPSNIQEKISSSGMGSGTTPPNQQ